MKYRAILLLTITAFIVTPTEAHEGIVVGHSPVDPNGTGSCPTLEPLRLFVLPDVRIGSAIPPGETEPTVPGEVTELTRLATNSLLARPEFGGFCYVEDAPGLDYVDSANPCHAMTTAHTGGQPFEVGLQRIHWPSDVHLVMADPFGLLAMAEDGDEWYYANQSAGHVHPLWMMRRAGTYHMSQRFVSDFFFESEEFSLSFASTPKCVRPIRFDLTGVFNADVVDSGDGDTPLSFDAGYSWVINGAYGTDQGLPIDGRVDVFELGGPGGEQLEGMLANCLLDNGSLTSQAVVDLTVADQSGMYESVEMLLGSAGAFSNADSLVARMNYATGADQIIIIRQAAVNPLYFPLHDWHITTNPLPILSVGRSGTRVGGGFVRSDGAGIDTVSGDSFYFQRVTFPVDPTRELIGITLDDYTGSGVVGVFAISAMKERLCPTGDFDDSGLVDDADTLAWPDCGDGPADFVSDEDCYVFDFDFDDDVDLLDFSEFQRRFGLAP
ncbi:MAG: hypothetical protein R3E58_04325 [Phycisphaerae bacterium]|nr:hypothetical protein [Phycisphaerales bacterium]